MTDETITQAVQHIGSRYPIEPVLKSHDLAKGWRWFVLVPGSRQFLTDADALEMSRNLYRVK